MVFEHVYFTAICGIDVVNLLVIARGYIYVLEFT
jgi:hypothetical protein